MLFSADSTRSLQRDTDRLVDLSTRVVVGETTNVSPAGERISWQWRRCFTCFSAGGVERLPQKRGCSGEVADAFRLRLFHPVEQTLSHILRKWIPSIPRCSCPKNKGRWHLFHHLSRRKAAIHVAYDNAFDQG